MEENNDPEGDKSPKTNIAGCTNDDNYHSYFMDRINEFSDEDDDENASYKSCNESSTVEEHNNNELNDNSANSNERITNYPPETSDESEDDSLASDSTHDDTFYSDNDSNISDPGRDHLIDNDSETDSEIPQNNFHRDLLDYLGSFFSGNRNYRNRGVIRDLEFTDTQLESYISLKNKVDNELRVSSVGKFRNSQTNSDNLARNLVGLLISRERGDWSSVRRNNACLWRYEKVSVSEEATEPSTKCIKLDNNAAEKMMVDEEENFGKWNERDKNDDSDNEEKKISMPLNYNKKRVISVKLSDENEACSTKKYKEDDKFENIGEIRGKLGSLWRGVYGSRWATARLCLESRICAHDGCVNALHFNSTGNWLASGSDDRKIVITEWQTGQRIARFEVGHASNIFQVKFLPPMNLSDDDLRQSQSDVQMISCSRDSTVRYAALSSCGSLQYSRLLTRHQNCCHKTDVPFDSPYLVLSAGEDMKVMSSDTRANPSSEANGVGIKLCTVHKVPLYTIACSPVRSQEFAVAGKDCRVFIYDRRQATKPLYQLCPPHMSQKKTSSTNYHVTSVAYSRDGKSVLASYNDEDIYLMSTRPELDHQIIDERQTQYSQMYTSLSGISPVIHCYKGHRNVQTVTGVGFWGPSHEFIVSGSNDGHVVLWDRNTESIVNWMRADEAGVVNVLEAHPRLPLLATAGLDSDIKLWSQVAADIRKENVHSTSQTTYNTSSTNGYSRYNVTAPDYKSTGIPLQSLLSDMDAEATRIDAAWTKAKERVEPNTTNAVNEEDEEEENPKHLPFKLSDLKLITGLNWKMRSEYFPYSFDNTLDNLISMSRNHDYNDDDEDDDEDDDDDDDEVDDDDDVDDDGMGRHGTQASADGDVDANRIWNGIMNYRNVDDEPTPADNTNNDNNETPRGRRGQHSREIIGPLSSLSRTRTRGSSQRSSQQDTCRPS